ncbi:MAG: serine/threonine-protein phosphatase [Lachnospiraceae bacterium]|nr:serine/threonine-protein phosphatase [Lachnospiraceae bacterium]
MAYHVSFACISNVGRVRPANQDNFFCAGRFLGDEAGNMDFPLQGSFGAGAPLLFGVFDGLGGEERGEMASFLAAKRFAGAALKKGSEQELVDLCLKANEDICAFAKENQVRRMGTTAALLAFSNAGIALCNIGDSRIFRFSSGKLEQLSEDHLGLAPFGKKAPLSQCLGIPKEEMRIEPYSCYLKPRDQDLYLICSDGLTDMVENPEIEKVLAETDPSGSQMDPRLLERTIVPGMEMAHLGGLGASARILLHKALENGGRDNITLILGYVEMEKSSFWQKIFSK